ncbi:MAG: AAA family ATPase [Bacteroidales bacterium]
MALSRLKKSGKDSTTNYKFISLKTYNWDSPNNNFRKYRQVYDRWEAQYIGVELQFFNKKFDEENWDTQVTFKAFSLKKNRKKEELCCFEESLSISMDDNIVTLEKGWGNDEAGTGWPKGEYMWEAYLDDELLGSVHFHIEDVGVVSQASNPYFDMLSLKLYEGPDDNLPFEERKYLRTFNTDNTRYVFAEFRFINQIRHDWHCELFFSFYDDTRQLIGRIQYSDIISGDSPGDDVFTITQGWGNAHTGNWRVDDYTLEVEFQEQVIAVVPFSVGSEDREDVSRDTATPGIDVFDEKPDIDAIIARTLAEASLPEDDLADLDDPENMERLERKIMVEEAMKELDGLIGLESIKNQIRGHISYLDFLQVRKKMGIEDEDTISLHSVFTGNPGTGKTTVVKLLGKIYHAMGLLSQGHVHVVDSSDLVSGYVRQTGKATTDEIEKARGGILFIDEAYMLYRKGVDNDFGMEAIAELITEMSDGPGDIAIMAAGYPAEIKEMINSNPGLKSRFKYEFHFDDYSPAELMQIAGYAAVKKKVILSPGALKALEVELMRAYRKRDRTFGNARFVHSVIDEAKINMGVRVMKQLVEKEPDMTILSTIEETDVKKIFTGKSGVYVDIPPDEELLKDTLVQLDNLIGLQNIKTEIRDLIKLVRYYRETGKDVRKAFPIHSVFTGNPGTGKTTLARIIGNIYKALGILERGHLVESDASDLVAGYLGQTAMKTKERLNEAMGGVLFIDEAYSLMDGQHPDFGKKAIDTMIKLMDDRRGEFAIIVAGYPRPMQQFLDSNPGMRSRFDHTFTFYDFTVEELNVIALNMLENAGLTLVQDASEHLRNYLAFLHGHRNQYFGNARSVRKVVDRIVLKQNLRMASLSPAERTADITNLVIIEDLKEFQPETPRSGSGGIGFKRSGG